MSRDIQAKFEEYHEKNPWVLQALLRLAEQAYAKGRRKVGIKHLVEVLRWEYHELPIQRVDEFKISNDLTSRYARLIIQRRPGLGELFNLRELRA